MFASAQRTSLAEVQEEDTETKQTSGAGITLSASLPCECPAWQMESQCNEAHSGCDRQLCGKLKGKHTRTQLMHLIYRESNSEQKFHFDTAVCAWTMLSETMPIHSDRHPQQKHDAPYTNVARQLNTKEIFWFQP